MTSARQYPVLDKQSISPSRPISFVCVRFSDEYDHNLMRSDCVHDPLNQLITVDNRQNLFFPTLGAALCHGVAQARHDLVALIHEDVLLVPGWQARLEQSLAALEESDPDWGMVGAVGWVPKRPGPVGVFSDPNQVEPVNTLGDQIYTEAHKLDEQLLIFRRSGGLPLDPDLPSIHNIGWDLWRSLRKTQRKVYIVNAPTVHKYADGNGKLIQAVEESAKIQDRKSLTYLADSAVCDEYYRHKWGLEEAETAPALRSAEEEEILNRPLILLGRGGGGTRLASTLAQDCGLFLGNRVNGSGDCMDLVGSVYRGVLRRYNSEHAWLRARIVPDLRTAAADMLAQAGWPETWGFKLPETSLIMPEIREAFPKARYLHFHRDPAGTILRRTHMTARLDNHIGRTALKAAHDHFGLDRAAILSDSPVMRMAVTTRHQIELVNSHLAVLDQRRWMRLGFEETIANPEKALERFSSFSGLDSISENIIGTVSPSRKNNAEHGYSKQDVEAALEFLGRESSV